MHLQPYLVLTTTTNKIENFNTAALPDTTYADPIFTNHQSKKYVQYYGITSNKLKANILTNGLERNKQPDNSIHLIKNIQMLINDTKSLLNATNKTLPEYMNANTFDIHNLYVLTIQLPVDEFIAHIKQESALIRAIYIDIAPQHIVHVQNLADGLIESIS